MNLHQFFIAGKYFFSGPSQMFGTSTMAPPSAFHLVLTMHCYRPTMLSMGFDIPFDDNNKENNNDDSSPPLRRPPRQRRRLCGTGSYR